MHAQLTLTVLSKSGSFSSALLSRAEKLLRNKKLMRSYKNLRIPENALQWAVDERENSVMINTKSDKHNHKYSGVDQILLVSLGR